MLTALRAPGRLIALALALVFAVVAVLLGTWQFSRHQDRLADRALVERNYDAAPVPLEEVLGDPDRPWREELEWTHVEVSGTYEPDAQLLVRNRPFRQTVGYAVTVPLLPASGEGALLVDRGWVPNARDAATLPEVPPVPAGEVRVTGWLRPSEADLGRELPPGQMASIQLTEAAERTGLDLLGGYLVLDTESNATGTSVAPQDRPTPADRPDTGLGSHLAYALQWWLTAPVGIVLVLMAVRRDLRDARAVAEDANRAPGEPVPQRARPARRTRIWDEEDG